MAGVVVIGAGLGGLAAAARLAKLGHQVVVCERADRVGGVLGSVSADGFRWDTGAATTTLPAALRDLFRKSGRPLEKVAELVPVEQPRLHVFADGSELNLPLTDRAGQRAAWARLAGDTTAELWTRLVDSYGDTWETLRTTALENPLPDRLPLRVLRELKPWQTLAKVAERRLDDPRARAVLTMAAVNQRSDPMAAPGWLGVTSYVERTFGVWTFEGGFGRLADALHTRLAERGVEVRLGAEVTAVRTRDGAVRGVRLADGTELDAEIVVSDVDPRLLYEQLVTDPAAAGPRKRLRRTHEAQDEYVVHLGLAEPLPELPFETVLHGEDGQPRVTVRTGGDAPAGHQAWSVLVHGYPTDDALDLLAARGLTIADRVVTRLPAEPWRTGTAWEGPRSIRRRAGNTSPVRGLFCVGSGAHPGSGVPATALGAALVAGLVGKA